MDCGEEESQIPMHFPLILETEGECGEGQAGDHILLNGHTNQSLQSPNKVDVC
jgi:hypothetical protein